MEMDHCAFDCNMGSHDSIPGCEHGRRGHEVYEKPSWRNGPPPSFSAGAGSAHPGFVCKCRL